MEFGHGPFWKDFLFMLAIGVAVTIIRSIYQSARKKSENEKEHNYVGNIRNRSDAEKYIGRLISTHEYRRNPKGQEGLTEKQKALYDTIKSIDNDHPGELISNKQITEKYQRSHGPLNLLPTDFCYNLVNVGPDFVAKFLMSVEKGMFRFVDFQWQAKDDHVDITWTPKGKDVPEELKGKFFSVGMYHKGEYSWNFSDLTSQFQHSPRYADSIKVDKEIKAQTKPSSCEQCGHTDFTFDGFEYSCVKCGWKTI